MSSPSAENKQIVRDFLEVFSSGDAAAIVARLHPDATWWVSGRMAGLSDTYTRAQLGVLLQGVTTLYKHGALKITPTSLIGEGSHVAVEAESYAELNNGRVYNNFYHFLFEIAEGKILRVKEYMDTQHAFDTFLKPQEAPQ
ncbi:nuclear transport factor 2 family protein [Massilia niabensis]|uniref:Nuclear transport factor 2 family protein n=1 Tax=Massilia niabensis TaxID=544910 RepID=A0ABW0KZQ8_9BURK